jgi:xylulokinase
MNPDHLLGVDIGTQGTKAVLVDLHGRARGIALCKSRLKWPAPGLLEEDPEYQFRTVCRAIRTCLAAAGIDAARVAAIGIDGQMAGILGLGADGRHLTPYHSGLDARCSAEIDRMQREAGDEFIRKTGGPPSFEHGPKILWWKRHRGAVYRRIAAFVQPGPYAAMRLCELPAADAFVDTTYLHVSGLADNLRGRWDSERCRTFGIAVAKLPRIVEPHAVVGRVSFAAAARCRLKAGTPVVAGCGDMAASFLACGATREGICVDLAGADSVFAATSATFRADVECGLLGWGRSATPGLWHPYACIHGGGLNVQWFAAQIAGVKLALPGAIARLNRLATAIVPRGDDPLFLPHLGGRVSPSRPSLRGCWAGLASSHSAAHLYRAVLEGVALEYCLYREAIQSLIPDLAVREIRVTGGGQRNLLWNQIKADAQQTPVVQLARREGAPLGAALLAGFGVGLIADLDAAARRWVGRGAALAPRPALAAHYCARLDRFRRLLDAMQPWCDQAEGIPS